MTHWIAAVLATAAQAAQPRYVNSEYGFEIAPMAGWERVAVSSRDAPVVARWLRPRGPGERRSTSEQEVRNVMAQWPTPMEELKGDLRRFLLLRYKDSFKELWARDVVVDGMPAHLMAAEVTPPPAKEGDPPLPRRINLKAVIQRTLLEHFFIDLEAPAQDRDALAPAFEDSVKSFRSRPAELTPEELADLARFADLAGRWAADKAALVFDDWFNFMLVLKQSGTTVLKGKRGYYHLRTTEADVKGRRGISFESRLELTNLEQQKVVTVTRGMFRYDLTYQEASSDESFHDAQGALVRRHELSAATSGQGFAVKRSILWSGKTTRDERQVAAPPATVLGGVQEVLRRAMAARGKNVYRSRVLYLAEDRPRLEQLDVSAEEVVEIRGQKVTVRPVLARRETGAPVQFEFAADGRLLRERLGARVQLDRTTQEDALKPAFVKDPDKP